MLKNKSAIILSTLALSTTTGCADFLEDFPFDTLGNVGGCPSCGKSTGFVVGTAGSTGTGLGSGNDDATSVGGDETGTQRECADPNSLTAPYVFVYSGSLTGHTKWTCDRIYILEEGAQVEIRDGILDIEPGTTIKGKSGSALIIEKDAVINAVGTPDKPIVFTSDRTKDKTRGDWGGLVLLGNAPTNQGQGIFAEGFPIPRTYGGTNAAHNCGTLQYVRVEWAGFPITIDNELNAITFYGCGTETKMDHVQVHMGFDDGIEWFGGGFDAHHLIVTGAKDDSLDMDLGFSGRLQHIFVHQDPVLGHSGFEVSSNKANPAALPRTKAIVANATIIGSGSSGQGSNAFIFKEGAEFEIYNTIAINSTDELFDLWSPQTMSSMTGGISTIAGSILSTADTATALMEARKGFTLTPENFEDWLKEPARGNFIRLDAELPSASWGAHNIKPPIGGRADTGATDLPSGLVQTDYIGAVDPNAAEDWTKASWTNYSVL